MSAPGTPTPWQRYEDAGDADIPEAFCLMVVHGLGVGRLLEVFGADPTPVLNGTFGDVWEAVAETLPDDEVIDMGEMVVPGLLQFIEADGWRIVVDAGASGTTPRIVEAASEGGVCAAFSTDINAHMHVVLARHGHIVRAFDPLLDVSDVGEALPEEADLPFGDPDEDPCALSLLLMERWTGCPLPDYQQLFEVSRPTYRYTAG